MSEPASERRRGSVPTGRGGGMRPDRRIRSAARRASHSTTTAQQQGESHTQRADNHPCDHAHHLSSWTLRASSHERGTVGLSRRLLWASRLASLFLRAMQRSTSMMPQPAGQCNAAITLWQGNGRAWTRHHRDWRGRVAALHLAIGRRADRIRPLGCLHRRDAIHR